MVVINEHEPVYTAYVMLMCYIAQFVIYQLLKNVCDNLFQNEVHAISESSSFSSSMLLPLSDVPS